MSADELVSMLTPEANPRKGGTSILCIQSNVVVFHREDESGIASHRAML